MFSSKLSKVTLQFPKLLKDEVALAFFTLCPSPLLLIKATHISPRSLLGVHYCTSPKSSLDTLNITGRPLGEQRVGGRGRWGGLVDARGRAGADHTWTSELKVPSCGIPQLSRWVVSNRLQLGIHSRNNKWDDPCPR